MDILNINLGQLLGIDISADFMLLVLAALVVVLIIVMIVNAAKTSKLKKAYKTFMSGKDVKSLEDELADKFKKLDSVFETTKDNRDNIKLINEKMQFTFQKSGMIKYDAFNEMGGKLSFALALLNQMNDGVLLNAMHTREGCYTYIKEIVDGNSYIVLSKEEEMALAIAKGEMPQPKEQD